MDQPLEQELQNLRRALKAMLRDAPDVEVAWRMVASEEIGQDRIARTLLQAFVEIYE